MRTLLLILIMNSKNYRLESNNSFYQAMTSRIYHIAALIYGNFIYNKKPTFDISAFIHLTFKVYIRKWINNLLHYQERISKTFFKVSATQKSFITLQKLSLHFIKIISMSELWVNTVLTSKSVKIWKFDFNRLVFNDL